MTKLVYKTKYNTSPKNKPKVYFTCHPDDFYRCFEQICDDIFKTYDCAIFYTDDMTTQIDDENRDLDLYSMNLFIIPVTFRLLNEPNRAMDEDYAFADEKHIPVLPLMMESHIDEFYMRRFGERQYIYVYENDPTKRSYSEQLEKYLSTVFLNKKTVERIRNAFDAYIFLSYRKKDRHYANKLMRIIHSHPELEKLAIWYDEFLTPGESFMGNIQKILSDSQLFTLLVTPNLIEKPNFVMDHEYPAAHDSGKPILPVQMIDTDSEKLKADYADIPDTIDVQNEAAFETYFLDILRRYVVTESRDDPEHNYLVGLAYLDGIDVEVDKERGIRMISIAAESELPDAMKCLCELYSYGIHVKLNYDESLKWSKKLYDYYLKTHGEKDENTLSALNNLAYEYRNAGDYNSCSNLIEKCYQLCKNAFQENDPGIFTVIGNLATAYAEIGSFNKSFELQNWCYQLKQRTLGENHPDTLVTINNLAQAYGDIGDYQKSLEYNIQCYQISCEVNGKQHPFTLKSLNNLAEAYNRIDDYWKALEYQELCFQLSMKELGENHPDTLTSMNNLGGEYYHIGEYEKCIELLKKCYQLRSEVLGKIHPDTLTSMNNLAIVYRATGHNKLGLELHKQCYCFSCEVLGDNHPDTLRALMNLALAYTKAGNIKRSIELQEYCYNQSKKVFGEFHQESIIFLRNLFFTFSSNNIINRVKQLCEYIRKHDQIHNKELLENVYLWYKYELNNRHKAQEIKHRLNALQSDN